MINKQHKRTKKVFIVVTKYKYLEPRFPFGTNSN